MRRLLVNFRILGAVTFAAVVVTLASVGNSTRDTSAGAASSITVNSTANVDDGDCEGPPNDTSTGNCTLHEAIDFVNAGDAGIITFHPPVFADGQPGVINLCADDGEGELPDITRDIVIDSKDSGVILDGGSKDGDCSSAASYGLRSKTFDNGFDFELNGGKNFTIRNINGPAIEIDGSGISLGTIDITGVSIENVIQGVLIEGAAIEGALVSNSEIASVQGDGIVIICDNAPQSHVKISGVKFNNISGSDIEWSGCPANTPTPSPTPVLPDLVVTKTASSLSVGVGEEVSFFIEVRNEGTGLSLFTRVIDDLPAAFTPSDFSTSRGTCAILGSIEGGTLDCDLGFLETGPGGFANVVVAGSFDLAGEFENFAEVDPFDLIGESNEGNNSSSVIVAVSGDQPPTPSPTSSPPATVAATATPAHTSTLVPTSTSTPAPATPDGDVNCGGTTDAVDAALILQFVAGLLSTLPCPENADVNQDGVVGPIDATLVLQAAAGLLALPL